MLPAFCMLPIMHISEVCCVANQAFTCMVLSQSRVGLLLSQAMATHISLFKGPALRIVKLRNCFPSSPACHISSPTLQQLDLLPAWEAAWQLGRLPALRRLAIGGLSEAPAGLQHLTDLRVRHKLPG